jgi:hypothetical protein
VREARTGIGKETNYLEGLFLDVLVLFNGEVLIFGVGDLEEGQAHDWLGHCGCCSWLDVGVEAVRMVVLESWLRLVRRNIEMG